MIFTSPIRFPVIGLAPGKGTITFTLKMGRVRAAHFVGVQGVVRSMSQLFSLPTAAAAFRTEKARFVAGTIAMVVPARTSMVQNRSEVVCSHQTGI